MTGKSKNTTQMRTKEAIEHEAYEEIPEWTAEDFARARPMREIFPEIVEAFEKKRGERGPQKSPLKARIGLRLDVEIVDYFRHLGPGWQKRINEILAKHVRDETSPSSDSGDGHSELKTRTKRAVDGRKTGSSDR